MAKGDTTEIFTVRPGVLNTTASRALSPFWKSSTFFRFYSFMQGEAGIVVEVLDSKMLSLICWEDLYGIFPCDFDEQLFKKSLLFIPFPYMFPQEINYFSHIKQLFLLTHL